LPGFLAAIENQESSDAAGGRGEQEAVVWQRQYSRIVFALLLGQRKPFHAAGRVPSQKLPAALGLIHVKVAAGVEVEGGGLRRDRKEVPDGLRILDIDGNDLLKTSGGVREDEPAAIRGNRERIRRTGVKSWLKPRQERPRRTRLQVDLPEPLRTFDVVGGPAQEHGGIPAWQQSNCRDVTRLGKAVQRTDLFGVRRIDKQLIPNTAGPLHHQDRTVRQHPGEHRALEDEPLVASVFGDSIHAVGAGSDMTEIDL
jgi:hypothetical protein